MAVSSSDRYNSLDRVEDIRRELQDLIQKGGLDKGEVSELEKHLDAVDSLLRDSNSSVESIQEAIHNVNIECSNLNDKLKGTGNFFNQLKYDLQKISNGFNQIKGIGSDFAGATNELLGAWEKVDKATSQFTRELGGSVYAMNELRKNTIQFAQVYQIGIRFNKSMEELLKLQSAYSNELGRTVSLTNAQKETMAAMGALLGDQQATRLAASFEKFGLNFEEAGKRTAKMFQDAAKHGVSFQSLTNNVAQNMGLASRYSFTNGIKGLTEMALKATSLRLNMQAAASMAEKVQNVEGAATVSANLSVLGGSIASGANPLSMMYEGLNDLEGLQDRIVNMFGNLGKMNYQTGEVEIGAFDKQRIKAAASAAGLDYGEMLDMVQTKGRKNAIRNLTGGRWANDEAFEDMITNAATIKDGKAYVNINGQDVDVANLTKEDEGALKKATQDTPADIKEIAENTRSLVDMKEGFGKQLDVTKARHAEMMGYGQMAKKAVDYLGRSTFALEAIRGFLLTGAIFGAAGGIFGRLGNMIPSSSKSGGSLSRMSYLQDNTPRGGGGGGMSPGGGMMGYGYGGYGAIGGTNTRNGIDIASRFRRQADGSYANSFGKAIPSDAIGREFVGKDGATYRTLVRNGKLQTQIAMKGVDDNGNATTKWQGVSNQQLNQFNGKVIGENGKEVSTLSRGQRFKNAMSGSKMSMGTKMGIGMGAGLAAQGIDSLRENAIMNGSLKRSDVGWNTAAGAASGALQGVALGSMFGPLGMIIGGLGGAALGAYNSYTESKSAEIIEKLAKRHNYYLNGQYSLAELETIQRGRNAIQRDMGLMRKMQANSDPLPETFSKGGPVIGKGSGVSDSIPAYLSNGEYVMKKSAVDKIGVNALDIMNSSTVTPVKAASGGLINSMKVHEPSIKSSMSHQHSGTITHSPIQIQFPNGMSKQVSDEVTQSLLNNQRFLNDIGMNSLRFSDKVINRGRNNEEMHQRYGFS